MLQKFMETIHIYYSLLGKLWWLIYERIEIFSKPFPEFSKNFLKISGTFFLNRFVPKILVKFSQTFSEKFWKIFKKFKKNTIHKKMFLRFGLLIIFNTGFLADDPNQSSKKIYFLLKNCKKAF